MKTEEQIYNSLVKKEKPVFLYFFFPGQYYDMVLNDAAEDMAKEYNEKVDFIRVNCSRNLTYCRSREFDLETPAIHPELLLPYDWEGAQDDEIGLSNAPFL